MLQRWTQHGERRVLTPQSSVSDCSTKYWSGTPTAKSWPSSPALEKVAPLVAEAYVKDHRGLDAAFDELNTSYSARDPLRTTRATAVFRFHLNMHLNKEDTHLYRIVRERVPMPEQEKAVGIMAGEIPQERFPEVVAWMFPLMGQDDRENMTRIWQMVMPAPAFAGAKELIKKAVGSDWAELTQRIPTL